MSPMSADPLARLAERQAWITPQAQIAVQEAIKSAFESLGPQGQMAGNLLHGAWLHEPLHAVLTDIPVGAWTAAIVFDAIGSIVRSEKLDYAADASVLLGLVSAAGAAITGFNDWAEIHKPAPRRIGAVHALLNIGATVLFAGSAFSRRKKSSRSAARSLAALGFVVLSASAHLGGNLVYEHGIGTSEKNREKEHGPGFDRTATAQMHELTPRDPENRSVPPGDERAQREKSLDKTLADSFPTSDPPSSIPDPVGQV